MLKHKHKIEMANKYDEAMQPLHVESSAILKIFMNAKKIFNNGDRLGASLLYESAIDQCTVGSVDQALCLLNAGKTLLYVKERELTDDKTSLDIQLRSYQYLERAYTLFEKHFSKLDKTDAQYQIFIVHIQKTLAYMATAAMNAKKGDDVFAASLSLLQSIEKFPNDEFKLDAYRYLYQCCLAKNDLIGAQQFIDKALAISGVDHDPDKKHQYKLHLIHALKTSDAEVAKKNIEALLLNFYKDISDITIVNYRKNPSNNALRRLVLKDLSFIFKMQLMCKTPRHAYNAVMKLAKSVFTDSEVSHLKELRNFLDKDLEAFNAGKLPLGLTLYKNDAPPYLQLMTATLQRSTPQITVASSPIDTPVKDAKTEIATTSKTTEASVHDKKPADTDKAVKNAEVVLSFRPAWMSMKKSVSTTPTPDADSAKKPFKKD